MLNKTKGEKIFDIFNYILLGVLGFVMLYPFLHTLSISFSTKAEALRTGLHLFPREVSLLSYRMVFKNPDIITAYGNTIFRTVTATALTLIFTSLTAYPLSKKDLPLRNQLTFVLFFTMLFNGGLVPTYLLFRDLKLINTRWVLILPGLVSAWNVFLVRNYFQTIPDSLEESAMLDGASNMRILFSIIIPLSMPILATIALWTAVGHWNAWFDAMIYIDDKSKIVLQQLLQRIIVESNVDLMAQGIISPDQMEFTPETVKAATIMAVSLPILCVYPFLQKYFVKGILVGSIKG